MQEFRCDSPSCDSYLTASEKHDLMRQVEQHVKDVHKVRNPSQTILSYLASTVSEAPNDARR